MLIKLVDKISPKKRVPSNIPLFLNTWGLFCIRLCFAIWSANNCLANFVRRLVIATISSLDQNDFSSYSPPSVYACSSTSQKAHYHGCFKKWWAFWHSSFCTRICLLTWLSKEGNWRSPQWWIHSVWYVKMCVDCHTYCTYIISCFNSSNRWSLWISRPTRNGIYSI